MCQHYEAEQRSIFRSERTERLRKWQAHESGEHKLSDDEIRQMVVEEMMARDAGV